MIKILREGKEWTIMIDGKAHSIRKSAEILGIPKSTLAGKISKNIDKLDKIEKWVEEYTWRSNNKVGGGGRIFTNPEGCKSAVVIIHRLTGRPRSAALADLKLWENGKIDSDELCTPINILRPRRASKDSYNGNDEWKNFDRADSPKNIRRRNSKHFIASPTELEKKLGKSKNNNLYNREINDTGGSYSGVDIPCM